MPSTRSRYVPRVAAATQSRRLTVMPAPAPAPAVPVHADDASDVTELRNYRYHHFQMQWHASVLFGAPDLNLTLVSRFGPPPAQHTIH